MQQSNALRKLETLFDEAIKNADKEHPAGPILLERMNLEPKPQNLVDFYVLLEKSEREAKNLKDIPKIDRYIKVVEELHEFIILNNLWNTQWKNFIHYFDSKNVLSILDALANYVHSQNPKKSLESKDLTDLNVEFQTILNKIHDSDLSISLKNFLIRRIEEILQAINRSNVDGIEEVEKSAKAFVTDLALTEHIFKDEDRKNPIYQRIKSWTLSLVLALAAPSPYDFIGVVPDLYEFWIPKVQELTTIQETVERISFEKSNIQEIFEEASNILSKENIKSLSGKNLKSLPPALEST